MTNTKNNAKIYVWLAVATILVLAFCIGSYYYLDYTSDQAIIEFDQLETALMDKDWQAGSKILDRSFEYWQGHKTIWQTLIDHREVDDIEVVFLSLRGCINAKTLDESLQNLYVLEYNLKHVPQTKALSLGNFF